MSALVNEAIRFSTTLGTTLYFEVDYWNRSTVRLAISIVRDLLNNVFPADAVNTKMLNLRQSSSTKVVWKRQNIRTTRPESGQELLYCAQASIITWYLYYPETILRRCHAEMVTNPVLSTLKHLTSTWIQLFQAFSFS